MTYKSTRQVAKALDVPVSRLSQAVWRGSIPEPVKGPSGTFLWTTDDVQRAARVLGAKVHRGEVA